MADRFRHEYKYFLDARQEGVLRMLAGSAMAPDPYAGADGTYMIRSLYFDDLADSCVVENDSGTDPRSKFRIRYYNDAPQFLKLEKKSKVRGMTLKEACSITPEECRSLMDGRWVPAQTDMPPQKQALLTELRARGMLPKVIVTYERIPFVYPGGNVRVTFDRCITSSGDISRFLEGSYTQRPILPVGQSLLEVKWDEVFPWHLQQLFQTESLQWTAFSKYYMCRTYHL